MRNIKFAALCFMSILMFNSFTFAAENDMEQLPKKLEEITLDNISRLRPLITFPDLPVYKLAWSSDGQFLAAASEQEITVYHFLDGKILSNTPNVNSIGEKKTEHQWQKDSARHVSRRDW